MKIEIGNQKPENFKAYWEGQYSFFSHFEYACGIPSILHAVTTMKENGKPNVNFNAWGTFSGYGGGFYAILPFSRHTHTYKNIQRTGEFAVNFIGKDYFDACIATINDNGDDTDEIAAGGFTAETAKTLAVPRLAEAFLTLECKFEKEIECGNGMVVIGKVNHIAMSDEFSGSIDGKYENNGFMLNIHAPKNLKTGEGKASAVAVCKIIRINEEG